MKKKGTDSNSKMHPVENIVNFISKTTGLKCAYDDSNNMTIYQCADGKRLNFKATDVEEVLNRKDSKSEAFIQINFYNDKKVILTDKFIGFKPFPIPSLDMVKIPKVVTTPDLLNFIEVIEDSMYELDITAYEVRDIKRYFDAVLMGAERVGFDVLSERVWIERLFHSHPALVSQVS